MLEQELKLEAEYKQLVKVADLNREAIITAQNRRKELKHEIQFLKSLNDTSQQKKITDLKKEKDTLSNEIWLRNKALTGMDNQIARAMVHCNFQKDILKLWDKEDDYKTILNEAGSTRKALLQYQGYTLPLDEPAILLYSSSAKDYARIGRHDIADLLIKLTNPENYSAVFEKAQREYTQSPDYNWGYVLSLCLDNGLGTKMDKQAAFAIDSKFAEQNHPLALCGVASEYFDGDLIPLDTEKAIQFYRKATMPEQQSFYLAHALWGMRLIEGEDGIEKNEMAALQLLYMADKQGCSLATLSLIDYFLDKVLEPTAEIQNTTATDAANSVAEMKGIQEKIYFYSKKQMNLHLVSGKFYLAECYEYGYGVVQNLQEYLSLLKQCAAMKYPAALETLATHYQFGFEGLQSDAIQSLILYFEYLRSGHPLDRLEDFQALLADNKTNHEFMRTAYELCKKCLEGHLLDNELDSFVMGLFYQHGILVPQNIAKAILCFKQGADSGNAEAATSLVQLSLQPEYANLIPITLARKYFSNAYTDEVSEVRLHYYDHYLPLFRKLQNTWLTIGVNMPDGVSELITAYADAPSARQEQEQEQKQAQEASLIESSALGLPTQASIHF
jgi:TPR repeat protein